MTKLTFMRLWDTYHGLLTPTQQEITDLYFNLDLTVSEIAAEKGISRQAVSDCLSICKKQLEDYENKLKFAETTDKYLRQITEIRRAAEELKAAHPELAGETDELFKILNREN